MADREKLEDEKLKKCLQEAYGYSDEQLLREMEAAERSLGIDEFSGAETRMFQKIMELEAAQKAEGERSVAESVSGGSASGMASAADLVGMASTAGTADSVGMASTANTAVASTDVHTAIVTTAAHTTGTASTVGTTSTAGTRENVIRFGKKKVVLAAALVAVFVGMLGGTAVGEKSYFFRILQKDNRKITISNDRINTEISSLQEAYAEIESKLDMKILKFSYLPSGMKYSGMQIDKDRVEISFDYEDRIIRCLQIKKDKETSIGIESDRKTKKVVHNEWLNKDIEYSENILDDMTEYESLIIENDVLFFMEGQLPEEEFIKIIKNINFY